MCGRYILRQAELAEKYFKVHGPPGWIQARYNIAPTQTVPVVIAGPEGPLSVDMRWGLIPFFAKGVAGKYSTINARAETVAKSPAYRAAWKRGQRCLLPAAGFYEWRMEDDGRKQPYFIRLNDQEVFGFAGLWDRSTTGDGKTIESCAIITLNGNVLLTHIHNTGPNPHRMPAILHDADHVTWLSGSPEAAATLLAPYPAEHMVAWPVSTRVNSPKNTDERLIEPMDRRAAG